MWSLRPEHFKMIYGCFPPLVEQGTIVRFLDYVDRRTRRYIRAKQQLIKLLEEQKQVIIHRAVTRGLDPEVRLKPSGINGMEDIPKHWETLPFTKCAVDRADYRGATPEKVDSGVFLVTAKNIRMGWIDYESSKEYVRTDRYEEIMRRGLPKLGDLLLTTEAPLGHVALVDREEIALAQRIIRFRMDEQKLLPKFTLYSMMSPYFQWQLQVRATGSTAEGIKASKLPQLVILRAPLEEQQQIVIWVEHNAQQFNQRINKAKREIDLIRGYRTRLVADIVTGKLDVRDVDLPEVDEVELQKDWEEDTDVEAEAIADAEEAADADE